MAKNVFLFSSFFFIGICIFFSCTKVESDIGHPVIEFVSIDSIKPLEDGDTLYTDSIYILKSNFRDDEELSSYTVQIWSAIMENPADTFTMKSSLVVLPEDTPDSAIFNKAFQDMKIWGVKDSTVKVLTALKIDSTKTVAKKNLHILLGSYYLRVTLANVYGVLTDKTYSIEVQKKGKKK